MLNFDKRINYCLIGSDNLPHIVVVIKWEKGNLYFVDIGQPWKKSYHTPRNGKSQVHIKVNGRLALAPDFCIPIEEIKGVRRIGGSDVELENLSKLPIPKEGNGTNYILDTRPFYISKLSKVQWYHYLVEPNNDLEINKILNQHKENAKELEMSEQIAVHRLIESTPWIVTEFTRICDENPL